MDIGIVRPVRIEDEMKGAYLDYAMSVITARALPDVRDGLKPVQRRILYSMDELGLRHSAAYKKSARIVGEVMGKYHPHGDAPVYESMVRLAQDFSMRYQLVDGQGNFGSVDGDPPAAMRYTEARLASIAEEMLADIDKDTVAFTPNFDDTLREPSVLPAKLPNLLVNGSAGIAVGMATNIPPHNLSEVIDALTYVIGRFGAAIDSGVPFALVWGRAFNAPPDATLLAQAVSSVKPAVRERMLATIGRKAEGEQRGQALLAVIDELIDVPPDKLVEIIKGPDFPTAGIILGSEGIKNAYGTGHGRITIRAKIHTEDIRGARSQIVVTELPYQVNKATLLEKIAELVRERRVEGISDLRDESDRHGMRVVIELRRDAQVRQIINQLYKYTAMQTSFSMNMLALVEGQPRVLTLKMALLHYLNHRREVITRRTEFDLQRARQRAHILEGLTIALDHLDEVIATIRRSKDAETARAALIKGFKLSEAQAQAILDMQLRRLAALERQKIRDELAETRKLIARLEDLLANPVKILYLIRDELTELKTKYGDDRRTRIVEEEATDFTEEDLVPEQDVVVSISAKGYVRRVLVDSFRLQRRGTKGIVGTVSKEDDPPLQLVLANTRDTFLLFTNRGRALQMRVNDVPDAARQARGLPLSNFITLEEQERVVGLLPFRDLDKRFVVLATQRGEVKRVTAGDYAGARSAGIIGFAVPDGDELLGAVLTTGREEVILLTSRGQAIRFAESELRPSGRASGGVRGIKLGDGDLVVSLDVARAAGEFAVVTRRGFAKRTAMVDFSAQGRGGGGIRAATVGQKNGELVAGAVAHEGDELIITTSAGTVVRSPIGTLPMMGRTALGAPIVSLGKDEKIVAAAVLPIREKPPVESKGPGTPEAGPAAGSTGGSAVKKAQADKAAKPPKGSAGKNGRQKKGKAEAAKPPKAKSAEQASKPAQRPAPAKAEGSGATAKAPPKSTTAPVSASGAREKTSTARAKPALVSPPAVVPSKKSSPRLAETRGATTPSANAATPVVKSARQSPPKQPAPSKGASQGAASQNEGWRALPESSAKVSGAPAKAQPPAKKIDARPSDAGEAAPKPSRAGRKQEQAAPKTLLGAMASTLAASLKKKAIAGKADGKLARGNKPGQTAAKPTPPKQPGLPI